MPYFSSSTIFPLKSPGLAFDAAQPAAVILLGVDVPVARFLDRIFTERSSVHRDPCAVLELAREVVDHDVPQGLAVVAFAALT